MYCHSKIITSATLFFFLFFIGYSEAGNLLGDYYCNSFHHPHLCPATECSNVTSHIHLTGFANTSVCKWQAIPLGYCLSFDPFSCILSIGACPFTLKFGDFLSLSDYRAGFLKVYVANCSSVNDHVCAPLNREGLLCSRCRPGYGLALYARSWECVECDDRHAIWMWVLYLALELVPLFIFYLVVVVFNMQAATPPYTAYVFYCQLFSQLFRLDINIGLHFELYGNKELRFFVLTLIDFCNLDFFRHIIPRFCVSSQITSAHATLMEVSLTLCPLLYVVVTYLCIELHARNFKLVVKVWKPFHKCFAHFRRSWNPQASIINAFTTFILLSMSKLVFLVFYSTYSRNIYMSEHRNDSFIRTDKRLVMDPHETLPQLSPLFVICAVTVIIQVLLPGLCNVVYPIRCLHRTSCLKCIFRSRMLWTFMDSFQGYYRTSSGTDSSCDYRYFVVVQFINRFIIGMLLVNFWHSFSISLDCVQFTSIYLILWSLFYALARPYKKSYMNTIESLLYGLAAIIIIIITSLRSRQGYKYGHLMLVNATLLAISLPSLILIIIIAYSIVRKILGHFRKYFKKSQHHLSMEDKADAGVPDRLVHPNLYTSLIP